jgi:hypothetical protein
MACHRVTETFSKIVEPLKRKKQTLLVSTRTADILTAKLTDKPRAYVHILRCCACISSTSREFDSILYLRRYEWFSVCLELQYH